MYVLYVIGPTNPIHISIPSAAPRAAVLAFRQTQSCASTNAITRFRINEMMYGAMGFEPPVCSGVIFSSAIHGLLNSTANHSAPSTQYAIAATNTLHPPQAQPHNSASFSLLFPMAIDNRRISTDLCARVSCLL